MQIIIILNNNEAPVISCIVIYYVADIVNTESTLLHNEKNITENNETISFVIVESDGHVTGLNNLNVVYTHTPKFISNFKGTLECSLPPDGDISQGPHFSDNGDASTTWPSNTGWL